MGTQPCSFITYCPWLLPHGDGRVEYLQQKLYVLEGQKYLLSGLRQKKFAGPCPTSSVVPSLTFFQTRLSLKLLNFLHHWPKLISIWASQVVLVVKNPPTNAELVVKNPPTNAGDVRGCGFDSWLEKIPWRKAWQPTPVFFPGKSHRQRSLVDYSP